MRHLRRAHTVSRTAYRKEPRALPDSSGDSHNGADERKPDASCLEPVRSTYLLGLRYHGGEPPSVGVLPRTLSVLRGATPRLPLLLHPLTTGGSRAMPKRHGLAPARGRPPRPDGRTGRCLVRPPGDARPRPFYRLSSSLRALRRDLPEDVHGPYGGVGPLYGPAGAFEQKPTVLNFSPI